MVREQFRICGTPGFGDRITDEHDARWRRRCEVRVLAVVPAALRPVERAPGVRIASPLVGILSAGACQNAHAGPGAVPGRLCGEQQRPAWSRRQTSVATLLHRATELAVSGSRWYRMPRWIDLERKETPAVGPLIVNVFQIA